MLILNSLVLQDEARSEATRFVLHSRRSATRDERIDKEYFSSLGEMLQATSSKNTVTQVIVFANDKVLMVKRITVKSLQYFFAIFFVLF